MRFSILHSLCLGMLLSGSIARGNDVDSPVELLLTPKAIESPILKYRLLPTEPELTDGNAAVVILRMPWDQQPYMTTVLPKLGEQLEIPFVDRNRILATEGGHFEHFYRDLRRAAYMRSADWNYPMGMGQDAYITLPDVQGGRHFVGSGLAVWIRYQIAQGELDRAREGILVGLAVSRHYSRTPFTIIQLVSNSLNGLMFDRVEELISQPEAPNLYWGLTTLPSSLLNLQASFEVDDGIFERSQRVVESEQPEREAWPTGLQGDELQHLDRSFSVKQWEEIADAVVWLIHLVDDSIEKPTQASRDALIKTWVERGRVEIIEKEGFRGAKSYLRPDAEVAVRWYMASRRKYSQLIRAYSILPPRDAIPLLRSLEENPPEAWKEVGMKLHFGQYSPLDLYVQMYRTDQRVALLRTIEALRHYAAAHEGKLPATLSDITDLPVPRNPLTDEPFSYSIDGETATLTAEPVTWQDVPNTPNGRRPLGGVNYRVRMRRE